MGEPGVGAQHVDAMPADALPREHRPGWLRLRLVLGVLWAAVAVAVLLLAPHERSPEDLLAAVGEGRVDRVAVVGGLEPGAEGSSAVEVRWRDGGLLHQAELVERTVPSGLDDGGAALGDGWTGADGEYVVEDVAALLRTTAPADLRITPEPRAAGTYLFHVPVHGAVAILFMLLWIVSLAVVLQGPRPWRATRWAWFWLTPVPFGMLLFVLLSGPLPGRWSTEPARRRLTGGWAFLLTLLLSSALPAPLWW